MTKLTLMCSWYCSFAFEQFYLFILSAVCFILLQFVLVVFSYLVVGVVAVSLGFMEMVHVCATLHLMAQLVSGALTALPSLVQVSNNDFLSHSFWSAGVEDPWIYPNFQIFNSCFIREESRFFAPLRDTNIGWEIPIVREIWSKN